MNKTYRQGQILKLIRNGKIHTQEKLSQELALLGIEATQVTLSRDIRELNLSKTAAGYTLPQGEGAAGQGQVERVGDVDVYISESDLDDRDQIARGVAGCGKLE